MGIPIWRSAMPSMSSRLLVMQHGKSLAKSVAMGPQGDIPASEAGNVRCAPVVGRNNVIAGRSPGPSCRRWPKARGSPAGSFGGKPAGQTLS
jgi:hypothetical protein